MKKILYTKGRNESEVEQSLIDFLHYVESSKAEDMRKNCDERLMRLHEVIESVKAIQRWRRLT